MNNTPHIVVDRVSHVYHPPGRPPVLALKEVSLEILQRAIDTQQQLGFLKAKLDVNKYADLSIVREAAARIK